MRGFLLSAAAVLLVVTAHMPAQAAPAVTVVPGSQKPTKPITVAGTGFGDNEAVDVYLDTTDTLLLASTATGTFSGSLTLPASTPPGQHYATAVGRHSGVAAQLAFTVSTPWAQFGFGIARTGVNPYENVLSTSNVPSLGVLWNTDIGPTGATPAVADGRVFVSTSTGVAAINIINGATVWDRNLGENFSASPTLLSNRLYIGGLSGNFYVLNTVTGATVWKVNLPGGFYSSAVIANGMIYVGTFNGSFYALNANTGAVVWSYAVSTGVDSSPALANGNVYFGGYNNYVYCLNAANGALVWSYLTGGHVESTPAIVNGTLFVGSDDDKVYAIGTSAANAGQLQWSYTTSGNIYASPAVYDDLVYVGSADNNFYALNARTGAVYFTLATKGVVRSAIAANGVLYFTSQDNDLYATNSSGGVLTSGSFGADYLGSPAVSDGTLFLATSSGNLYALAPSAGNDAVPARKAPDPSSLHRNMSLPVTR